VNKLAVRLAAGSDHLAELVRRDQELAAEAEALDKTIVAALSRAGGHDAARESAGATGWPRLPPSGRACTNR